MKPSTRILLMQKRLLTPIFLGSRLALWLDAADSRTIILDGSTASQWRDKSGNGCHVSQSNKVSQPTHVVNGLNGKPALRFSGSQVLNGTIPRLANQTNLNFFGVLIIVSRTYAVGLGSGGVSNPTSNIRWGLFGNGANVSDGIGWVRFSEVPLGNGLLFPVSTPFQSSYIKTATNWNILLNGTVISGPIADTTFPTGAYNVRIGAESSTPEYGASAMYSEFVITTGSISSYEHQQLTGYFAHKWRLTADLANNHPFKFRPPYM